jgi:hypothetical protein
VPLQKGSDGPPYALLQGRIALETTPPREGNIPVK